MSSPSTVRPHRSGPLTLLFFAMVVVIAAFAQVGLALGGRLPAGMVGYGAGLGVLALIAHFVVVRFAPYADPVLLPLVILLNGLGLAMIYRIDQASGPFAEGASAPSQILWTALGIGLFTITVLVLRDTRMLQRYTYTIGALGLILLALPIAIGTTINGSKIWLRIGGFSIQPGEFAKLALVVFFAGYLVAKRDTLAIVGKRLRLVSLPKGRYIGIDLPRLRDLGPVLVAWLLSIGVLVFEKDLGTSLLFFGVFITMLYIATQHFSWVLIGLALFMLGAYVAAQLFSHVRLRVDIWLNPWDEGRYEDESFQLVQGLYGMATGGTLGTGLGQGEPDRYPFAYSDLIFAAFGEELGLTGVMVILLATALVIERGLKAAVAARDPFAKLFAAGLAVVLALQVFVVVGGVTRLVPLTGLTTPFLSQGGSSLLANWILIAILVRISDASRRPAPQPIQDEGLTQVVRP